MPLPLLQREQAGTCGTPPNPPASSFFQGRNFTAERRGLSRYRKKSLNLGNPIRAAEWLIPTEEVKREELLSGIAIVLGGLVCS
jgi:hypothetical protein